MAPDNINLSDIQLDNSQLNINIGTKSINELFNDACLEVREHITHEYANDITVRSALLGHFGEVENHFGQHNTILESLSNTICCYKNVSQSVRHQHFVRFIQFCIGILAHHHEVLLPNAIDMGLRILSEEKRSCTGGSSAPVSVNMNIGALADMLSQNSSLQNGTYYIFNLIVKNCNNDCPNIAGDQQKSYYTIFQNIFLNFFRGKQLKQAGRTFMDVPIPDKIDIKCGECLSNVSRLTDSGSRL